MQAYSCSLRCARWQAPSLYGELPVEVIMLGFRYTPEIFERYPHLQAGIIIARNLQNGPTPESLQQAFLDEQRAVIQRIEAQPLSEIESLAAWRAAFRDFGVDPTRYRSAPEALLRRLTKKGEIPSINRLVDIGNLVSIRHGLPVAAFDMGGQPGFLTVKFAAGDEWFTPLGEEQPEHPEAGEVIFLDPLGRVAARRWCWRQSDQSAARETTHTAIITIEAQHRGGEMDLRPAIEDSLSALQAYCGGETLHGFLSTDRFELSDGRE
jgi:DNA/RNA-binding domain of Phe-tRNA-synthetase-like protein